MSLMKFQISTTQDSQTTLKPNLAWIFLSVRAKLKENQKQSINGDPVLRDSRRCHSIVCFKNRHYSGKTSRAKVEDNRSCAQPKNDSRNPFTVFLYFLDAKWQKSKRRVDKDKGIGSDCRFRKRQWEPIL